MKHQIEVVSCGVHITWFYSILSGGRNGHMTDMQKCISKKKKKGKLEIHAHSRDTTVPNNKDKKLASKPGGKW